MRNRWVSVAAATVFCIWASPAAAQCYMDTPSGFQRMGGASRIGPYPSMSACESVNQSQMGGQGRCSCSSGGPSGGTGGGFDQRQWERDQERQRQERLEAERRRQEAERQRQKEAEQRAFEKAKQDALGLLKGSASPDAPLKEPGVPPLKGGTDLLGTRGTAGGELKLKPASPPPAGVGAADEPRQADPSVDRGFLKVDTHSSPVDTRVPAIELPLLDPAVFKAPPQRLRIRAVPSPMQAPKGTWQRYVEGGTADLILDALEAGDRDLDRSIAYLEGERLRHGTHRHAESALSYLEGLRVSYIGAEAEWRKHGGGSAPVTVESRVLLEAISGITRQRWPGPENPDPGARMSNPADWRVQRTERMLDTLQRNPGDLMQAFRDLEDEQADRITAANARRYLQGVYAYLDFLSREEVD